MDYLAHTSETTEWQRQKDDVATEIRQVLQRKVRLRGDRTQTPSLVTSTRVKSQS